MTTPPTPLFPPLGPAGALAYGLTNLFKPTVADNTTKMAMSSAVSVINKSMLDMDTVTQAKNIIKFDHCTAEGLAIMQKATAVTRAKGVNDALFNTNLKATLAAAASQSAEAVTQNLNLNPGGAQANNLTDIMMRLHLAIGNTFSTSCKADLMVSNEFECISSDLKNITVNMEAFGQTASDCVQKSAAATSAIADLKAVANQSATAKTENVFNILLPIIIAGILLLLGGYVVMKGTGEGTEAVSKILTSWQFWVGGFFAVALPITGIVIFKVVMRNDAAAAAAKPSALGTCHVSGNATGCPAGQVCDGVKCVTACLSDTDCPLAGNNPAATLCNTLNAGTAAAPQNVNVCLPPCTAGGKECDGFGLTCDATTGHCAAAAGAAALARVHEGGRAVADFAADEDARLGHAQRTRATMDGY
jgi:hypothetical protein